MASIVITGDTSGAITLAAPAVAGTNTLTLPATTAPIVAVSPGANGNILTSDGTTWVSSAPSGGVTSLNGQTGAITNTNKNAIGSVYLTSDGTIMPTDASVNGSTIAGSNITYFDGVNNVSAGLTGTWRALGAQRTARGIIFMRVS